MLIGDFQGSQAILQRVPPATIAQARHLADTSAKNVGFRRDVCVPKAAVSGAYVNFIDGMRLFLGGNIQGASRSFKKYASLIKSLEQMYKEDVLKQHNGHLPEDSEIFMFFNPAPALAEIIDFKIIIGLIDGAAPIPLKLPPHPNREAIENALNPKEPAVCHLNIDDARFVDLVLKHISHS
ncbi:hypothetical protein EMPS_00135 [Entomortierella parvispora]|uniref:Uncharacterized protein n=1 Tax=Entomortierella parvispora TaxID=205924 RepID=A0A9P3GZG3_9FUNG|nr:hypothetical protein EMPS_00135 [Entomortierella parvispora]